MSDEKTTKLTWQALAVANAESIVFTAGMAAMGIGASLLWGVGAGLLLLGTLVVAAMAATRVFTGR